MRLALADYCTYHVFGCSVSGAALCAHFFKMFGMVKLNKKFRSDYFTVFNRTGKC